MNRKFILLTLTLISIICFSQTKDTIFLKKEKGHNIYKIQNRNSKMYNDLPVVHLGIKKEKRLSI